MNTETTETTEHTLPNLLCMKVSEKGCVSIYGLQRFPVSLYQEQWLHILNNSDEIRQFIKDNKDKLKSKQPVIKNS